MADIFDFMLGKKDKKKPQPSGDRAEKNNYSIFMPVGVMDEVNESDVYGGSPNRDANSRDDGSVMNGRREDLNPYAMDKLKSDEQLIEMKRQISSLEDDIRGLKDTITSLKNESNQLSVERSKYQNISSKYRAMIEKIIKIMPYYQDIEFTGVGSPEQWADRQLVEMFVTCIEDIKVQYAKKVKEIEQLKSLAGSGNNVSAKNDMDSIEIPDISEFQVGNQPPQVQSPGEVDIDDLNGSLDIFGGGDYEPQAPNDFGIGTEHLEKHIDKINEDKQLKIILETIGETGLSRVIDLKETDSFKRTFVGSNGDFNQGMLSKKIQMLENLDIVSVEKITTGRKGGYENIYSLSDTGSQLYKLIIGANPVESEKESIKRQHTSLEHGYFIKTVGKELSNKGYYILDDPKDCVRRPLVSNTDGDDKLRVEADLIIKRDEEEFIIECEMGTTSDSDMNKKLDKLVLVTNVISFIMNNQESLNATSSKVDKWISKKGRNNLKGYTFRFTTLDSLKKREIWQNKGPF